MWPSDDKLQEILDALTAHFSEDIAQDALVILGQRIKDGVVIENPFAFCWGVAENKLKGVLKKRDNNPIVSLSRFDEWDTASRAQPGFMLDERDPARTIEAREILETIPAEYILDTPLSPDERASGDTRPLLVRVQRHRALREVKRRLKL